MAPVSPAEAALAVVGLEEDTGAGQHAGGGGAGAEEGAQLGALLSGQDDAVELDHGGTPGAGRQPITGVPQTPCH